LLNERKRITGRLNPRTIQIQIKVVLYIRGLIARSLFDLTGLITEVQHAFGDDGSEVKFESRMDSEAGQAF
jgi:hypothetical protein